jgi:cyclopropane fatty-acyl-phospholipid synthase-like methyltransferase
MPRTDASARQAWAVEQLAIQPDQRLLEIGCGHGVAVSLVCDRLTSGHIHALDRSATMIAMAEKRNSAAVAAGRASFQTAALDLADLGGQRFDTIFAIHVGVFLRGDPTREMQIVRRHLTPGGRFAIAAQPLDANQAEAMAERLSTMLASHGFTTIAGPIEDIHSGRNLCVIATPLSS